MWNNCTPVAGEDPPVEVDDVKLILRLIEKDLSALEELLEIYGPKVKGFLRTICSGIVAKDCLIRVKNAAQSNGSGA
jgi:hypothetical protein